VKGAFMSFGNDEHFFAHLDFRPNYGNPAYAHQYRASWAGLCGVENNEAAVPEKADGKRVCPFCLEYAEAWAKENASLLKSVGVLS
jgi:hypothetical protein